PAVVAAARAAVGIPALRGGSRVRDRVGPRACRSSGKEEESDPSGGSVGDGPLGRGPVGPHGGFARLGCWTPGGPDASFRATRHSREANFQRNPFARGVDGSGLILTESENVPNEPTHCLGSRGRVAPADRKNQPNEPICESDGSRSGHDARWKTC